MGQLTVDHWISMRIFKVGVMMMMMMMMMMIHGVRWVTWVRVRGIMMGARAACSYIIRDAGELLDYVSEVGFVGGEDSDGRLD